MSTIERTEENVARAEKVIAEYNEELGDLAVLEEYLTSELDSIREQIFRKERARQPYIDWLTGGELSD